jgi:CDP-glucose 4,6-dehydratase
VGDAAAVKKALLSAQPDFVFHLAAQPLVRLSYREPVETWETNVMGTINVLEALRALKRGNAETLSAGIPPSPQPLTSSIPPSDLSAFSLQPSGFSSSSPQPSPRPLVAVMITTDKCYENREWQQGYREEDPLGGYDP